MEEKNSPLISLYFDDNERKELRSDRLAVAPDGSTVILYPLSSIFTIACENEILFLKSLYEFLIKSCNWL